MTATLTHYRFGQDINPHRLSPLAQQIAAAIGDGGPASWAGFVWSRPQHARDERQPTTEADASRRTLLRLRQRCRQDHDLFTQQELARLAFMRWLYGTGLADSRPDRTNPRHES